MSDKSKSKSVMGTRQAAELDHAFERNGWTAQLIKALSAGDLLERIKLVVLGRAKIVITKHIIDLDAEPHIPGGLTVRNHRGGGEIDLNKIKITRYFSKRQQKGGKGIKGHELLEELRDKPVFNSNVLQYFLKYPEVIHNRVKGNEVFFWGTTFDHPDGHVFVLCLCWNGDSWESWHKSLDSYFNDHTPALLFERLPEAA